MFDPKMYRNACDRLTLDAEKLEEMIAMTENTKAKKPSRRPIRAALIAAACVAALAVTAVAAPAARQFFTAITITTRDSDSGADAQTTFTLPALALEEREGRSVLTVDGQETDVTDAFARDGQYVLETEQAVITVQPDGWVEVQMAEGGEGGPITYSFSLTEDAPEVRVISKDTADGGADSSEVYEVTLSENRGWEVADDAPAK